MISKPDARPMDAAREAREAERQRVFKQTYEDETPSWYRGEYHLAFTVGFTVVVMLVAWFSIENANVWEWLLVLPMMVFGNWAEWAGHRYVLHRPIKGLEMVFKRHCGVHHQYFTSHDLTYKGHKSWRALLFPPFAPVAFVLLAVPPAMVLGYIWSANAAWIMILTMAGYYLLYEGLHTLSHLTDERHPYLKYIPLVNTIRHMHITHHDLGFMQTRNFNLTFPLCDALFGTSDIDRGVIGTLFNGTSRKDDLDLKRPGAPKGFGAPEAPVATPPEPAAAQAAE